jgi:hypothetical protein
MAGADFTGVWMSVPGYHHHWWGGSSSRNKCVRLEDTVDTQLRGGSCYDAASCPTSSYYTSTSHEEAMQIRKQRKNEKRE